MGDITGGVPLPCTAQKGPLTAMQIRLTVLGPPSGRPPRACDVLITAPAGTALAAVASGLATAAQSSDSAVVLYAGSERLDAQRSTLGEPPLVDGAVLSLNSPSGPGAALDPVLDEAAARLHVVAGPDAGGVHLLHGGRIGIGRSVDADIPLDDPDVSRTHCAVTVETDGRVSVVDLDSTNGTAVDGSPVAGRPVRLMPGSLLRIGESALRLACDDIPSVPTAPDGEGHVRVRAAHAGAAEEALPGAEGSAPAPSPATGAPPHAYGGPQGRDAASGAREHSAPVGRTGAPLIDSGDTAGRGHTLPQVPVQGGPPPQESDDPSAPREQRRRGGLSAWARRLAGPRTEQEEQPRSQGAAPVPDYAADARTPDAWPDPAALLLTALGPGPRLWERGPAHPETLVVRLGTADRAVPADSGLLPAVPVTVGLLEAGSLGLAGPQDRLAGLARSVVAQLTALHAPDDLDIVLISTDRSRPVEERTEQWAWLGWLPHVRPVRGQDCRLLLAYDREQAAARTEELVRRLDDTIKEQAESRMGGRVHGGRPHPGDAQAEGARPGAGGAASPGGRAEPGRTHEVRGDRAYSGPRTVVVVDGDPGSAMLREATARLAAQGTAAGIHVICLARTQAASPSSSVSETFEAAGAQCPAFRSCGAVALLSGDVATALRLMRTAGGSPVGQGTVAAVDAVSAAWAERFARALAPLRPESSPAEPSARVSTPLPRAARLLDELGLARATPASLMARWASATDASEDTTALGGRVLAVLGAGLRGPVAVDLGSGAGPHLLIEGPSGSGRTELLRSVAASLAAAERPDRLGLVLMDGKDGRDDAETGRGEGLRVCTDLPHVTTHLGANDPVRMREFAQSLAAELKRRAELLGRQSFSEWHARSEVSDRLVAQRTAGGGAGPRRTTTIGRSAPQRSAPAYDGRLAAAEQPGSAPEAPGGPGAAGDIEAPPSNTLRLRPSGRQQPEAAPALPRLVVVVDDIDALLAPALGSPGRPSAGSVVRALEAVARDGERLGVHLVAATARTDRTEGTELARRAGLRITLDAPSSGPEDPAPGRGGLRAPDGRGPAPFQSGRVTGRIPRTATQRPTVVPLEWERMGDPPTRRPVRELGNGPTDLALLASALERAARSVQAAPVPSLL